MVRGGGGGDHMGSPSRYRVLWVRDLYIYTHSKGFAVTTLNFIETDQAAPNSGVRVREREQEKRRGDLVTGRSGAWPHPWQSDIFEQK